MNPNRGFENDLILDFKRSCDLMGKSFLPHPEEYRTSEYAHVFFAGSYEDREVIFDAVIYTLRLHHESELYRMAEEMARRRYPTYYGWSADEADPHGDQPLSEGGDGAAHVQQDVAHVQQDHVQQDQDHVQQDEEIGMYMAEAILELEEDERVKVKEHVESDPDVDFGVGLDVGLHVTEITDDVIEGFISSFRSGRQTLDSTLHSFQRSEAADD